MVDHCCDFETCEMPLRSTMLLEEAKAANLDKARFLPLIALMRIESNYTPTQYREKYEPLPASPFLGPCPCMATVGFERGKGVPWNAWNNEEIRAELLKLGLVSSPCDAGDNCAMKWSPKAQNALQAQWMYVLFEEMMLYRWEELRDIFSLGGTQMYLKYVGLPGFPKSWEEIWDVYTGRTNGWFKELLLRNERQPFILAAGQDQNKEEQWLAATHTGNIDEARKYWRGERPQYGAGYGVYLQDLRAKAAQIGW